MRKDIIESVTEPKKDDLWLSPEGLKKFGKKGWELLDKNITSSTPIINEVQGNELVPIQQNGENKAVSVDALIKGGKEVYIIDLEDYNVAVNFSELKEAINASKIIMNGNNVLTVEESTDSNIILYGYIEAFLNNALINISNNGTFKYNFSRGLVFNSFFDTNQKRVSLANYSPVFVYIKNNYFNYVFIPFTIAGSGSVEKGFIYNVGSSPISAPVVSMLVTTTVNTSSYDKGKVVLYNKVFKIFGDTLYTIPTDEFLNPASIVLDASSDGTKFLSDDGSYKEIDITSATPYIFNYTGQTSVTQEEYDGLKAAILAKRNILVVDTTLDIGTDNMYMDTSFCAYIEDGDAILMSLNVCFEDNVVTLNYIIQALTITRTNIIAPSNADITSLQNTIDTKQNKISDIDTIRANAALGATALQEETYKGTYTKPSTGIPKTDLASAVQTSLNKADTALQEIPAATDTTLGGVKQVTVAKLAEDADITAVVTAYNDLIDKLVTSGIAVIS